MFMTYVEIKYGLLAMVLMGVGLLGLVVLISGAHLLMREVIHGVRRRRSRRTKRVVPSKRGEYGRQYSGAGK